MTWVSYGDDWATRPVWDQVAYETRWLYFAVVERCSRDLLAYGQVWHLLAVVRDQGDQAVAS